MARSAGASPGAGDGGLRVENLEKRYPDGTLIGPLGFTVAAGEFFSLLGPSGCGKTTTLKCIAGIETPTGGSIHLGARDLMAMPANRRPVGIVFQNLALFPHLTVASNIAFGLKLRKLPAREIDRKVRAIAEQVEVTALLDRMPSEISGGQQQRVAIARSLVLEPELLLLDEPSTRSCARTSARS
jgi:ABC-type Fe3+/spermidine/putrescine transport system ATPase subunit